MDIPLSIADTITVRSILLRKVHIKPLPAGRLRWITQLFPVLGMMVEGSGRIVVPEEENTGTVEKLWDPFFLPANRMRQPSGAMPDGFKVLVLGFSVDVLGGIPLLDSYRVPLVFSGDSKKRLKKLMLELYELESAEKATDFCQLAGQKSMLFEIFGILMRHAEPKMKGSFLSAEGSRCLPAVQYLKEHYDTDLDLDALRDMCNMSQTHFFRQFKHLTGVSPFTYMKDRRIEEAQRLLVTTSLSVLEIGERVGWHDQFHFSRTFKSRTGYSPRQYRKQFTK